jgi:dipeptidase E
LLRSGADFHARRKVERPASACQARAAFLGTCRLAIDDETAIKVVDGTVEVVSEGHWKLFTRGAVATESG